jgi:signal transduction histidine kinase
MSLEKRLLLFLSIPGILLFFVGLVGVSSLARLSNAADRILSDNYRSIQEARKVERELRRLEYSNNEALVELIIAGIEVSLARCEANITESGEGEILREVRSHWQDLKENKLSDHSAEVYRIGELLYQRLHELIKINESAMLRIKRKTRETARITTILTLTATALALIALFWLAAIAARSISKPVAAVSKRLHEALNPEHDSRNGSSTMHDEIKRLELELDQMLDRLADFSHERRFEDSRQRFIAMLSHQLKTPLTSLSMSVNLLKERLRDESGETCELIGLASQGILSLSNLVSELLDAAKGVTPGLSLRPTPVNLVVLLRNALKPLFRQAEQRGVKLLDCLGEPRVFVSVDPVKFFWVVTNAVGNALRYTAAGGKISIGVKEEGDLVSITVSDTGEGIEPERLRRIFEPSDPLRDSNDPGSHGLGLSIAREIVEAHRGSISIQSVWREGTTLIITIPKDKCGEQ